jgi:CRP-like cAMP-binding protein
MDWPLLASIPEDERRHFLATARRRSFARNEVVMHEGDPADSLHLVESGRLAVRVSTPDGSVAMLNVLSRGDYFGELALLRDASNKQRSATVIALEPSVTWCITEGAFRELRTRHPAVDHVVTALLVRRVEELSARLLETLYLGLDRRVYRRLDELARLYAGEDSAAAVSVPLTQDHLAEMVGGTRQSVNQVLQRLATQHVVELGRARVVITDRAALHRKAKL